MERKSSYVGTDIGIKLLPAVGVSLLSKTHSHSSCSTVMVLLCIPVSELVSCTFSTIPICPFEFFHLLVYFCKAVLERFFVEQRSTVDKYNSLSSSRI